MRVRAWFWTLLMGCLAGVISPLAAYGQFGDEGIRFFFDTKGVGEEAARPANDPLGFTNPTVTGVGRLYIYFEYGTSNQEMIGYNMRIDIAGPANIVGGRLFNHTCNDQPRWAIMTSQDYAPLPPGPSWYPGAVNRQFSFGYHAKNVPNFTTAEAEDSHFRQGDDGSTFGTTLLGYVDVAHTSGSANTASVKFSNGDSGHAGITVTAGDTVYFGFGDAGTQNKANRTSANPDAFVAVPEPATAIVLMLGAMVLGRRRK